MKNNTNIFVSDRLLQLIQHYDISTLEFSKLIGFERADKIYNILNGKFNPSFEILVAITNKFVEVNIDWLITGNGTMLRQSNSDAVLPVIEQSNSDPPTCLLCEAKDGIIAAQKAQIETQAEYIECLKEISPQNSGQKRKAC